jgi:hypothetical protein
VHGVVSKVPLAHGVRHAEHCALDVAEHGADW